MNMLYSAYLPCALCANGGVMTATIFGHWGICQEATPLPPATIAPHLTQFSPDVTYESSRVMPWVVQESLPLCNCGQRGCDKTEESKRCERCGQYPCAEAEEHRRRQKQEARKNRQKGERQLGSVKRNNDAALEAPALSQFVTGLPGLPQKRGRGRPKGSKNKPKLPGVEKPAPVKGA